MSRGKLKLFANRSGGQFADKISKRLRIKVSPLKTIDFADGETKVIIEDSVRGCDVYLVQCCFDPNSNRNVYQNFFELLQTGDALKRAGASKITAILPYHPFSRQDKSNGREPLTARLAVDLIETSGFDNVITSDLHAPQMVGFYKKTKIDNLPASEYLIKEFKKVYTSKNNLVVMAPDAGGAKRAELYAINLNARAAQAFKIRSNSEANKIEQLKVAGLVEGYNVLIIDDMIDTAGSLKSLVEKLKTKNVKTIYACCTHALLNKNAISLINELGINLVASDTIPRNGEFKLNNKWYKEVSLAELFAKAINHLNNDKSVSELYCGESRYH